VPRPVLRAATRGSPLARWQTDHVASLLAAVDGREVEVASVVVETSGDRNQEASLSSIGGQGVFVKEVQAAVLDGRADLAVHSAKDLPSLVFEGLVLAAVPPRGDPRDVLVGGTLAGIPTGGRVATGSVRRRAQLAYLRPDLTFAELRGNIATRLEKAAGFEAIVMAAAALHRLGLANRISEALDVSLFVPQVAQGALAVECRADDGATLELLGAIEDRPSRMAVDAERAFLAELGGGCTLPAGAHAVIEPDGSVTITAMLATVDGRLLLRETQSGDDPVALGRSVALYLLDDAGGRSLLDVEFDAAPGPTGDGARR
jgi:hydroxymethylbilane synthase